MNNEVFRENRRKALQAKQERERLKRKLLERLSDQLCVRRGSALQQGLKNTASDRVRRVITFLH
jgi:outer membrane lipopolysaccharide assembly protein LptE/RlpB